MFKRIPFGRFRGHSDRVLAGVAVSHPILTLSRHRTDFSLCRECHLELGCDEEE